MDEQRKSELKIIAGKIGWILLIAYLGSLILLRIMPIVAENMAFYIFWADLVCRLPDRHPELYRGWDAGLSRVFCSKFCAFILQESRC